MRYRSQLTSMRSVLAGTLDAKPTEYRRYTMRSKLERDFAWHLDMQDVLWRYEPAVFGPVGEGYLPDFLVEHPDGRLDFIEVKPTLAEVPKAQERMEVIWESYPEAALIVACAEECRFFGAIAGGEWRSWVGLWKHS